MFYYRASAPAHTCQHCTKAPRQVPRRGQEPAVLTSQASATEPASFTEKSFCTEETARGDPPGPGGSTAVPHTRLVLPGRLLGAPAEGAANRGGGSQSRLEQRHPGWRRGREACQLPLRNHRSRLMAQRPGQAGPQQPQGGAAPRLGKGPEPHSGSTSALSPGKPGRDTSCVCPRPAARIEGHRASLSLQQLPLPGPHGPACPQGPNPRRYSCSENSQVKLTTKIHSVPS